jgi:Fe-S cluster assembly protein SufD
MKLSGRKRKEDGSMTEGTSTLASVVQELSRKYAEPEWLKEMRESAWNSYVNTPVVRLEKSDLSKRSWEIENLPLDVQSTASDAVDALVQSIVESGAPVLYVRDGQVVRTEVPASLSQRGVIVTDMHTAVAQHGELVKAHLGSVVRTDESKWAALNAALWQGGAFVYVPKNTAVDVAVHFVHEDTGAGAGIAPRILVVADENSSLSFVEVHVASSEKASGVVTSHVAEVVAKANARVTFVSSNQFRKGPTHFATSRALVHQDASVDWVFTDVGDGYTVGLLESELQGSGSRSTIRALGMGYGRQHLDLTASMLHEGRYSTSDIVMHGVLRGRANSIYRSSTHIFKNAVGAGSEQHDRMLMLDSTARADAIPMLLIDENDVQRCGHAASVGRIDENQIYYLMSRGIPKPEATKMIVWGYLQPTVDAIPSAGVREFVSNLIDGELA